MSRPSFFANTKAKAGSFVKSTMNQTCLFTDILKVYLLCTSYIVHFVNVPQWKQNLLLNSINILQICNFNDRRKITHKILKISHVIVGVWKFNYDFKKVFTPLCLHKTNIASGKLRQYAYDAEYISCCVSNGWHLHTAYASSIYFLKFSSSKPSGTSSWFFCFSNFLCIF